MLPRLILAAFTLLTMGYCYLPSAGPFLPFLFIFTLQFGLYCYFGWRCAEKFPSLRILVIVALLNRLILLPSEPVLENDFYRYLWDGRVFAHGFNPYLFPPSAPELNPLDVNYRHLIGWPDIRTIYPPLSQFFFGALHLVAPNSLIALKLALVGLEVVAGILLMSIAPNKEKRRITCFLYFFNPLLLKEIANSAHLDALPMLLTTVAIALFTHSKGRKILAWVALALAACAKSYPVILLPLFWKLDRNWKRGVLAFLVTIAVFYLPFIDASFSLIGGWAAFSTYWIFNAGAFKVITSCANILITTLLPEWSTSSSGAFLLTNDYPAKIITGIAFAAYLFIRTRAIHSEKELPVASLAVMAALLLLSPVVNAWYVLWLLPLACLTISVPWLAFTYLVVASYSWFWSPELAPIFRWIEYISLFSLLAHARWHSCQVEQGRRANRSIA